MNNEFNAIKKLFQDKHPFVHPLTKLANGDDASVHQVPADMELVISTDTAVAGTHWPKNTPLDIAGHRAVCAALSDLAAMGAQATWIWIAIMAKDTHDLKVMSKGIIQACQEYELELAGGDTTSSPINAINVTVAGLTTKDSMMTRHSAKAGDDIWLIGDLGLSAMGLKHWQTGNYDSPYIPSFQTITPLLEKGLQLRELKVLCCMDVSDGLMQDASHIALASEVLMTIEVEKVQQLPSYQKLLAHNTEEQTLGLSLRGGEDYALLFTAPPDFHQQLSELGALPIGQCTTGQGVTLTHLGSEVEFNIKGFDHFG